MIARFFGGKRRRFVLLLVLVAIGLFGFWFRNVTASSNASQSPWTSSQVAYGVNVDITAMIPGSGYAVFSANGGDFFALANQLGINTLRITDVQWATSGNVHSKEVWRSVFNEAASYHMHIILLLVDSDHGPSALQEGHILLDDYGLAHAPALWMVDVNNEPDLDNPQDMTELRGEVAYVHQVAPGVPMTIGGWKSEVPGHAGEYDWQDPKDLPRIIDLVDVVSPHLYGFDQAGQQGYSPAAWTQRFLAAVRQQARGKPILLEEFGAGNGLAPTTDPTPTGSPQWQAAVYRGVLQEVTAEHAQGVIGAVAWIIAPRPDPGYSDNQGDMTGWAFVLDHGQRLLPTAEVFSTIGHAGQKTR